MGWATNIVRNGTPCGYGIVPAEGVRHVGRLGVSYLVGGMLSITASFYAGRSGHVPKSTCRTPEITPGNPREPQGVLPESAILAIFGLGRDHTGQAGDGSWRPAAAD